MKKRTIALIATMCLIFSYGFSMTAMADDHRHTYVTYGEHGGHWTELCHEVDGCVISVSVDKVTHKCSVCGHSYTEEVTSRTHSLH